MCVCVFCNTYIFLLFQFEAPSLKKQKSLSMESLKWKAFTKLLKKIPKRKPQLAEATWTIALPIYHPLFGKSVFEYIATFLGKPLITCSDFRICFPVDNFHHGDIFIFFFFQIHFFYSLNLLKTCIAYTNTRRETTLEIQFIYLGNKEIYCIFKTCCIISVSFSTAVYFIILPFSV